MCVCVCVCSCTYGRVGVWVCACLHVCLCACVRLCMRVCVRLAIDTPISATVTCCTRLFRHNSHRSRKAYLAILTPFRQPRTYPDTAWLICFPDISNVSSPAHSARGRDPNGQRGCRHMYGTSKTSDCQRPKARLGVAVYRCRSRRRAASLLVIEITSFRNTEAEIRGLGLATGRSRSL